MDALMQQNLLRIIKLESNAVSLGSNFKILRSFCGTNYQQKKYQKILWNKNASSWISFMKYFSMI